MGARAPRALELQQRLVVGVVDVDVGGARARQRQHLCLIGSDQHDLDAGLLGEGLVDRGALGLVVAAAARAHHHLLALGACRQPGQGEGGRGGRGGGDQRAAAPRRLREPVCLLLVHAASCIRPGNAAILLKRQADGNRKSSFGPIGEFDDRAGAGPGAAAPLRAWAGCAGRARAPPCPASAGSRRAPARRRGPRCRRWP